MTRRAQAAHDTDDTPEPAAEETLYQWWEIPAQFPEGEVMLHLLEPAGTSITQLMRRVRAGRYPGPFVVDDGESLRLHFSRRYVQSQMDFADPEALALGYTRRMMSFLLFQPRPRHVVIVGLGGGSMSKFCYRHLPATRVTTVEIDPKVIELSSLFELPPPDSRLRIVQADAADYFAASGVSADVVLLDGCTVDGMAGALCEERFYASVRMSLSPNGVMVTNLVGAKSRIAAATRCIRKVFDGRVLLMDVPGEYNQLVIALCQPDWPPDWDATLADAEQASAQYGLPLAVYGRELEAGLQAQQPVGLGRSSRGAKPQ